MAYECAIYYSIETGITLINLSRLQEQQIWIFRAVDPKILYPEMRPCLARKRARKGVFITTSSFSQGARDYAASIENKIVLIDGEELAGLMIDYGVGVSTTNLYEIKRIDFDYFVDRVQVISFSSQVFIQSLIFEAIASRQK